MLGENSDLVTIILKGKGCEVFVKALFYTFSDMIFKRNQAAWQINGFLPIQEIVYQLGENHKGIVLEWSRVLSEFQEYDFCIDRKLKK